VRVIADKAYDSDPLRKRLRQRGIELICPHKKNRVRPATQDGRALRRYRRRVLYSLLAGTGLRIGEALALKIGQHISDNCSTIHVRQSLWRGKEQEPKTQAAVRDVDITRELAALLAKFIGDRKDGYLFCTETGKPLSPRNILRDSLHPTLAKLKQPKMGFHCFRRFRESVLQMSEARTLLVDYWMGHESREMGTRYAKQLVEDVAWRKQWAKKVRLGFKLTDLQLEVGQLGQLSVSKTQPAKPA
jgi:integrase